MEYAITLPEEAWCDLADAIATTKIGLQQLLEISPDHVLAEGLQKRVEHLDRTLFTLTGEYDKVGIPVPGMNHEIMRLLFEPEPPVVVYSFVMGSNPELPKEGRATGFRVRPESANVAGTAGLLVTMFEVTVPPLIEKDGLVLYNAEQVVRSEQVEQWTL